MALVVAGKSHFRAAVVGGDGSGGADGFTFVMHGNGANAAWIPNDVGGGGAELNPLGNGGFVDSTTLGNRNNGQQHQQGQQPQQQQPAGGGPQLPGGVCPDLLMLQEELKHGTAEPKMIPRDESGHSRDALIEGRMSN